MLAEAEDSRSIPLLRQALTVHDYFMQSFAAQGLASLHDKDSIPLIVDACKQAPPAAAAAIAMALVYFDDPHAQSAVDLYLPAALAKTLRDSKAAGAKPFE